MGVIIPFAEIKQLKSTLSASVLGDTRNDHSGITGSGRASTSQLGVLVAARPLLAQCRDRYGFVVMRDGLPNEPATLDRALLELYRGLCMLDADMGAPRTYPTFGVYFSRRQLTWFEDGYSGTTGLAVPNEIKAADLASFVRPRVATRLRLEE